ncbi:Arc-like DNA binding domain protein [Variibacter gotjawalensis]|uniref:Arc-like DNA binding domain protein n=1 Tax=Variibacter gotjawalensis TaxID=1333996 RepID=A0A0S3PNN9_9BRAD|nr:Arc family DNA-binding protein [Variibacter gotjawalensis]NIK47841.1 hypothetical protein [Variibacter gotjawalensis]RZS49729.1 Arc-like DNA binding dprotein [Variibacter gotjawalensis]BAT57557.1 Arc-like DNA binding domain protein [Variibacter gotjawalensis]
MSADPQMKLRLPRTLKNRVEAAAKLNSRSLNGEIVARLENAFREEDRLAGETAATLPEVEFVVREHVLEIASLRQTVELLAAKVNGLEVALEKAGH